jgi:hypothetical protein
MSVFGSVVLAVFAAMGIALVILEMLRQSQAKRTEFICVCFREDLLEGGAPDMLVICRTDAEMEEVIRRVCVSESRKAYIKRW